MQALRSCGTHVQTCLAHLRERSTCFDSPLEASGIMVATQPKCERPTKMALLPTVSCRSPSFFLAASGSRRGSGLVFRRSVAWQDDMSFSQNFRRQQCTGHCLESTACTQSGRATRSDYKDRTCQSTSIRSKSCSGY